MNLWKLIQGGLDGWVTLNRLLGADFKRFPSHRFLGVKFWEPGSLLTGTVRWQEGIL